MSFSFSFTIKQVSRYIYFIPLKILLTLQMLDMWEDHDFNPMWLSLIKPMWKAEVINKVDNEY